MEGVQTLSLSAFVLQLCIGSVVVSGPLSRPAVCPGSANGSRLVLGSSDAGGEDNMETRGPVSVTPGVAGSAEEEAQSSRGSGSTCAGQWQPVKLN